MLPTFILSIAQVLTPNRSRLARFTSMLLRRNVVETILGALFRLSHTLQMPFRIGSSGSLSSPSTIVMRNQMCVSSVRLLLSFLDYGIRRPNHNAELGGTLGDIESAPFVEAMRQMRRRAGKDNFLQIHVSLVPVIHDESKVIFPFPSPL